MYINPKITLIKNNSEKEDFFCSICGYCLISNRDYSLHKKTGGCEECYYTFIESRIESWDKDNKQINKKKLSEYIYLRKKISTKKIDIHK
jgi:hypothetical protein